MRRFVGTLAIVSLAARLTPGFNDDSSTGSLRRAHKPAGKPVGLLLCDA
ncbi:MAG: hypothetical protein JKY49_14350 [Cohaesibacteraceae bacterium]|nr:hypothetical protein [Cohaesibacteraceae bacterium]MBL4876307.1 hypothetical protein [Cohaesibacteraceae bacterium]